MRRGTALPLTVRALRGAGALALAALFAQSLLGFGDAGLDEFFARRSTTASPSSAPCCASLRARSCAADRLAWAFLGAGLVAWSAGEIHWTVVPDSADSTGPGLSDWLELSFYPASYLAIVLMVRARLRGASARLWLDGIVAALAAACVAAVFLFEPLIGASAEPGSLLLTDVAYPVGDLLLLAVVTGVFGLTGWRPGRSWTVIGAGFVAVAIADGLFLYQATLGSYVDGALLDALWPASTLPARLGRVGGDGRAPGARHHRPARDDRARRVDADRPRGARLRQPGQGPQRPRRRPRDRHAARRDPAHGPDLRRQRPDGGGVRRARR